MDVLDGARNVALLAGVGVVWLLTARATAAGGRLRHQIAVAGGVGLLLGLIAETAQLFSPVRTSSILDVMTNGLGAFLGAAGIAQVIAYGAREVARRHRHHASAWRARLGGPPLFFIAAPYAVAAWLEAFSPLGRPDRVPGAWGGPARRWGVALEYAQAHAGDLPSWSDWLLFAPAGALLTLWLMERGMRRGPAALVVSGGLATSWALAELLRGVAGGDMLGWAVVVHALASALGAGAAAWWTRGVDHDRARTGGHAAGPATTSAPWPVRAYAALLLAWSWRPFVPVSSWHAGFDALTPASFTPLAELASDMAIHSVADVGVGALIYAPLGAWLVARAAAPAAPHEPGALLRALGPGLLVGLVSECGQLAIAGRMFDVTDILVQWAGLAVGAAAWRASEARARARGRPAPHPHHHAPAPAGAYVHATPARR